MHCWLRSMVFLLSLVCLSVTDLTAQVPVAQSGGGPRFMRASAEGARPVRVEAARVPMLRRRVSIHLENATLDKVLREISAQSGVRLVYSSDVLRLDSRTSLKVQEISVAAALTEVLLDANVDVIVSGNHAAVVARLPDPAQQEPGTITGQVTEAESGNPIVNAQVAVDGRGRTLTGNDGRYRIGGVEPGRRTVSVTSIGYASTSREVAVRDDATVTVDFALDVSPSTLAELVVTATGRQRRVELGHVVGRINADSIVKEAPISTLSELLTGRVPGLHVSTHSGMVGGSVSLQSRSPNSISLDSEPILIVDGIRYANDRTGWTGPFGPEETSRLNDLNPNDIETIEVVKGPSAATLYGTDAANGVIVITTKRGQPGPARWSAYARAERIEVPEHQYPEAYWGWGTVFNLPDFPFGSCTLMRLASGQCTQQDSVVRLPHPLNDPELTMYHSKPAWEYGMNVTGGSQDLRYYFSTDVKEATGPIQMPTATIAELKEAWGVEELPDEIREPNAQRQVTVRGNLTLGLGSTAELQFNSGYGNSNTRTARSSYWGTFGNRIPDHPYSRSSDLANLFPETSTEQTDRVFGSITGQWQPARWLHGRGTFGLDLANSERSSLLRPEHDRPNESRPGHVQEDRTRRLTLTGDFGLSTEARVGGLSFRTAVGAQYTRQKTNVLMSGGTGLPPGAESVAHAEIKSVRQVYRETATLGSYLQETIGLNGRLFVTGALRVDGASNFGRDYSAAVYPKASASWLLSEEPFLPRVPGLDELRLRYAFGASGQQPLSNMVQPEFATRDVLVDGVTRPVIHADKIGNVDLKPERVKEHEFGIDAAGLGGRVRLEVTWFDRVTTDQIVSRTASLGFGTVYRNLGRLSSHGFEADLTIQPIETRHVTWQVTLQHALRRSVVEDLGGLTPNRSDAGGYVEGYPLGARFATEILGWDDANGDGILEPSELQMSPERVYQGESTAPRTQALVTSVGLFQRRLRLSALFQRQSGHTQIDWQGCGGLCRAGVDPTAPLEAQAFVVAPRTSFDYAAIEPADHTRLEEVTVAFDLPEDLLRAVRLGTGTVSLSARNLALWTSFGGPDPASSSLSRYSGGRASNIPQNRTWVLRFDLGS